MRKLLALLALLLATPAQAALQFSDLACETTTTTGTGTLNLGGAASNYLSFIAAGITTGSTVPYQISASNGQFETGIGTFTDASPDTLARTSVKFSSSGAGTALTLPAGSHVVCVGPIASIWSDANKGDITTTNGFQTWTVNSDSVALGTDTTGNYVASVADGTGIDGTATGEGSTYTPTLDLTEINSTTWGSGTFTTMVFDAGAVDPTFTFGSNSLAISNAATFTVGGLTPVYTTRSLTGGVGIAAIGDLSADRTVTLDLTELSTATFGAGAFTSLVFDAGATDPTFTFGSNSLAITNAATFTVGGLTPVYNTRTLTGGVGIAAIGDLSADRTVTLDLTELSTATFGAGAFTTLTFDAGATDPTFTFGSNSTTVSNSAVFSLGTSAALTTGTIELGAASDTTLARSAAGQVTVEGSQVKLAGTETMWIPAQALTPNTTNGCTQAKVQTTTNLVMLPTCDYNTTTQQAAQFNVKMPKNWNEGTITAQFAWKHAATTVNFGVTWDLACVSLSDNDAGDTAFGTAQIIADTGGTTNNTYVTGTTPSITCAGTPAEGDVTFFRVRRVPADAGDTLAIDAGLLGVTINYTSNAANDG